MNKTAKTVLTTLVLTLLLVGIVLAVLFGTGELIWAHSADKIPVSKYSLVFTSAFTQEEKEDFPAFLETGEQLFLTAEINFNIRVYEDKIILDKSDGDRGFVFGYDERVTFDLGGGAFTFAEGSDENGYYFAEKRYLYKLVDGLWQTEVEYKIGGGEERILLTARFDNLGKGASGAAIQNMNLALGLDERLSL